MAPPAPTPAAKPTKPRGRARARSKSTHRMTLRSQSRSHSDRNNNGASSSRSDRVSGSGTGSSNQQPSTSSSSTRQSRRGRSRDSTGSPSSTNRIPKKRSKTTDSRRAPSNTGRGQSSSGRGHSPASSGQNRRSARSTAPSTPPARRPRSHSTRRAPTRDASRVNRGRSPAALPPAPPPRNRSNLPGGRTTTGNQPNSGNGRGGRSQSAHPVNRSGQGSSAPLTTAQLTAAFSMENRMKNRTGIKKRTRKYYCESGRSCCGECHTDRCDNRLRKTECSKRRTCGNQRISMNQHKKVELFDTRTGMGHGLKTLERIKKGDFVIEYTGELIDRDEFNKREIDYQTRRNTHVYMFQAGQFHIDATRYGNLARFMNHSCEPNLESENWTVPKYVRGSIALAFFALKDIPAGTELTIDYNFDYNPTAPHHCQCGTPSCTGFLGKGPPNQQRRVAFSSQGSSGSHQNRAPPRRRSSSTKFKFGSLKNTW